MITLQADVEARRKPSKWALKRTAQVKERMERTYGKGLVGMFNEETGQIDPTRFGWDNKRTGGAPLGSNISVTIPGTNIVVDATLGSAFAMGFTTGMKYSGLDGDDQEGPANDVTLTNCFASMYSYISTLDVFAYNWKHIADNPGSFNWFDVLAIDPIHVMADSTVLYE